MSRQRPRTPRTPAVVLLLLLASAGVLAVTVVPRERIAQWRWPPFSATRVNASPQPAAPRGTPREVETQGRVSARLYFLRVVDGKERMAPVWREVPGPAPARAALLQLIAGRVPKGCARPLPAGVSVRGVKVHDGLVTADFSRELVSGFRGGSDNEGVTVYAIVNTLTSLPGVDRAQILVEGEKVDTLGGHLDISGPLVADSELVVPGG